MPLKKKMMKLFLHKWALVTLAVGFLITVFAAMQTNTGNVSRIEKATKDFSKQLSSEIVRRFELYQYGLRGSRGAILTAGSLGITRSSFKITAPPETLTSSFPAPLVLGLFGGSTVAVFPDFNAYIFHRCRS